MRKRYLVVTEARRYEIDLTEQEHEKVRRHYHGYVTITEVVDLDFDAIAQELHKEWKNVG